MHARSLDGSSTPGPAVSWHSSMVAALLAERKTAEPGAELLRSSARERGEAASVCSGRQRLR